MAAEPKVLHLLPPGHAWETARHVVSLAAALLGLGLPQGVAGPAGSRLAGLAAEAGVEFMPLAVRHPWNPLGWLELSRRLGGFRPGVAHAHGPEAARSLSRAARLGGGTSLVTSRYRLDGPPAAADCGPGAAAAVCPSAAAADWLAERGADSAKLVVIPAGSDLAAAAREAGLRDSRRARLRDRHCPGKEKPLFLVNIAPLEEENGQAEILEAMIEASASLPQAHLFIMGEGALERDLPRQARILSLESDVTILQPDSAAVPGLLAAADLYVSASRGDAAALTAAAALAAGRAAALSDSGRHPELAEGGAALLAKPCPGGLKEAVLELLGDRGRRERLGRRAGERAARSLGLAAQAEKLAGLYGTLARARR